MKKKILKAVREKWHVAHRGAMVWRTMSFSETTEARRKWIHILKVLKVQEWDEAYIWERLGCRLITKYGCRSRKWDRNLENSTGWGSETRWGLVDNQGLIGNLNIRYTHRHTHTRMCTPRVRETISNLGVEVTQMQLQGRGVLGACRPG